MRARRRRVLRWVGAGLAALLLSYAAISYLLLPDAAPLADRNPPTTALIERRAEEAREKGLKARRRQQWVPLSAIAPTAVAAVIVSEDAAFFTHEGVDVDELEKAIAEAAREGKLGRGASTITQQLAKNLWLSTDRSLLRKAKELVLTRRLEDALTKKRILTLYLNVVEWGDGVYGIEAASREHFGVSASALSPAQGAMLAAMLPAPRRWTPASRSPTLLKRSLRIVDRLESVNRITDVAAALARADIKARLGAGGGESHAEESDPDPD
jgi:monofunctional biosynthetic peptidoglycan transglycosylase